MRASPGCLVLLQEVAATPVTVILPVLAIVMAGILQVSKDRPRLGGALALGVGLAGAAILWYSGAIDI